MAACADNKPSKIHHTVEDRNLEYDCAPIPKENQINSSQAHVPTVWSTSATLIHGRAMPPLKDPAGVEPKAS